METREKLKTILNQFPLVQKDIEVFTKDGPAKLKAIVSGYFAVHKAIENYTYNITDLKSGMAIITEYKDIRAAILGVQLTMYTLAEMPNPFDCKDPTKNKTCKAIFKFLTRHKKVWNNAEMENLVGVFYRDRAECERLRHKINPKMPIEYLDENANDNKMIADLMMGN